MLLDKRILWQAVRMTHGFNLNPKWDVLSCQEVSPRPVHSLLKKHSYNIDTTHAETVNDPPALPSSVILGSLVLCTKSGPGLGQNWTIFGLRLDQNQTNTELRLSSSLTEFGLKAGVKLA